MADRNSFWQVVISMAVLNMFKNEPKLQWNSELLRTTCIYLDSF